MKYLYRIVGMLGALVIIMEDCIIQALLACLIVIPFHFMTTSNPSLSEIPFIAGLMFAVTTLIGLGTGIYYGFFSAAADAAEEALYDD
jgi:hypothetical protein